MLLRHNNVYFFSNETILRTSASNLYIAFAYNLVGYR